MKRFILIIWLSGTMVRLLGQSGNDTFCERVYVQTDKQLYLSGELVLMKVMTVDPALIPIVFSKVAYVELVDDTLAQVQIKVALTDGIGEGRMQLPPELPTGTYRLIAYTQFMRNEGDDVFFEKQIGVANTFLSETAAALRQQGEAALRQQGEDALRQQEDAALRQQGEAALRQQEEAADGTSAYLVGLQTDKTNYSTREHGELVIDGLPGNVHTLSVSIAGKDLMSFDGTEQLTVQKNKQAKPALLSGEYLPEYEGHIITAKIIDNQTGQTARCDNTLLTGLSFPDRDLCFYTGQITETGDVRFFTSGITGTNDIATTVYNSNASWRLDVVSPFVTHFAPIQMPLLIIDSAYCTQLLQRSVALQVTHYFTDEPVEQINYSEPHFKITPTYSYLLDDYTRFTTMKEVFIEFITFARFRRRDGKWELSASVRKGDNSYYGLTPLVLFDGIPVSDHELIYNYDPLLVERIQTYNYQCNIGGHKLDGIIELNTYRRDVKDMNFDKSTQIITYEGPQSFEKIVFPDYTTPENRRNRLPDSRHTLLWNPEVPTTGQSTIRVSFDTSDLTGEYQATVEGLTDDGAVVYATASFIVDSK